MENKDANHQIRPKHYEMPITPIEFIQANNLDFCVGSIIKYVTRFRQKNGKEDLLKARTYIDLILKHEYPNENN